MKVGQTFLSAVLVFTQRFVRLPLSSQERGPGGEVFLPECSQKKGLRRLYRANTRSPADRTGLRTPASPEGTGVNPLLFEGNPVPGKAGGPFSPVTAEVRAAPGVFEEVFHGAREGFRILGGHQ